MHAGQAHSRLGSHSHTWHPHPFSWGEPRWAGGVTEETDHSSLRHPKNKAHHNEPSPSVRGIAHSSFHQSKPVEGGFRALFALNPADARSAPPPGSLISP